MRAVSIGAVVIAAALGSSATALEGHATIARGGHAHASSHGGRGGRSSAVGGAGGDSTGGTGVLCGSVDLLQGSNDINNLGAGQLQLGNGSTLLGDLFIPVGTPAGGGSMSERSGVSTITGSRGGEDSGSTGNAGCASGGRGGGGARAGSASGGAGGAAGRAAARGGRAAAH
jgi:hypothetical protein